jgi:polar amino acid transport system substrate-binding protein
MKFAHIAVALMAVATVATLPARAELDDIKKAGVLKVAVPQDFPPFGTVGPDLKPLGYDIDVAEMLAKDLGVKVELVPVTSANRIPYLTTKKVDLVISSLGKNPDREKVIDFSTWPRATSSPPRSSPRTRRSARRSSSSSRTRRASWA